LDLRKSKKRNDPENSSHLTGCGKLRLMASGNDIMKVIPRKTGATLEKEKVEESLSINAPKETGST
jgi:hypothetical protein